MSLSLRTLAPLVIVGLGLASPADAEPPCHNCTSAAVDWTTLPSTYTHRDGFEVDRYQGSVVPVTYDDSLRTTSVYRHHRSSLQGVNSVDHYHRVDQYGPPVVPYGEWRYPYRPYSVPYDAWAPQLPQVYAPTQIGLHPRPNRGGFPGGRDNSLDPRLGAQGMQGYGQRFDVRGYPQPGYQQLLPGPQNALPATADEYYPEPPEPKPLSDRDFFFTPIRP